MGDAHDGRTLGVGRTLGGVALFGFGAVLLWTEGTPITRFVAVLCVFLVGKVIYEARRPAPRGVGPAPTEQETALLLEQHLRVNQNAGAIGGALGGGLMASLLTSTGAAAGGARGGSRSRAGFDRSPSFVIEQGFTCQPGCDAEAVMRDAVEAIDAKGAVEADVPALLTRHHRCAVASYWVDATDRGSVHVRIAERGSSKLADALLAELARSFD